MRRLVLGVLLALGAPGLAHADPISTAILTAIGIAATNTAVAITTFLLTTAGSLALSKVSQLLAAKGAPRGQERQASVTAVQIGETPREMLIGRAATGGSLVDAFNYGGTHDTDWEVQIRALADHQCDGLEAFYVDDALIPISSVDPVTGVVAGYNGQLLVFFRNGLDAEEGFPVDWQSRSPAAANGSLRKVCRVGVGYKADPRDSKTPTWSAGRPRIGPFVVRGMRVYDPRQDSTVEGGDGPQRGYDADTWTWSENPILCRYAWVRGVYYDERLGDPTYLLVGRGLSAEEAPPERVFAAANLCDEDVDGAPRYVVGGVIRAGEPFDLVEEMFAAAVGGLVIQPEGGVEVEPGQWKTPVFSITDDDLVIGAPVEFSHFKSEGEIINTVIPRYVEPAQRWADHAGTVQRNIEDYIADGGPREETLSLALVTSRAQAERIAAQRLAEARRQRQARITLPPAFAGIEEGDWGVWTSKRHTDNLPVTFRVRAYGLPGDWRNTLQLEEVAAEDYGGVTAPPVEVVTPPPPTPLDALVLSEVTVEAIQLNADGATIPAVRFTWGVPVDLAMTAIRAEIRKTGTETISSSTTNALAEGAMNVTNGVGPNMSLQGRLVPLGPAGRPVSPSTWVTVTTGGLVSDGIDTGGEGGVISGPEIIAQLTDIVLAGEALLVRVQEIIAGEWAAIEFSPEPIFDLAFALLQHRQYIEALAYIGTQPVGSIVLNEQVRTDTLVETTSLIGVRSDDGLSFILNADTVILDPETGETAAERFTALTSSIAGNTAAIVTEASTRATADSAAATTVTALTATVTTNHSTVTAAIVTEQSVRAAADSAAASSVTALGVTVASNAATVTSGFSAQATLNSAQATTNSTLTSSVAANAAAIVTEASTRATADSAQASLMTLLGAANGGGTAFVLNLSTVYVGASESMSTRLAAITSSLGTNSAAIASEASTRATADSANATSISTVSATVAGHTSAITTLESADAALGAKYGIALNVDGYVSGFVANNSGTVSEFFIAADRFGIVDPSGDGDPVVPFSVVDGEAAFANPIDIGSGASKLTIGAPAFGVLSDLILWFGPTMDRDAMSKSNGVFYIDNAGRAKFRGGVFGGDIVNRARSTERVASMEAIVGPFATDGRQKQVTVAFSYYAQGSAPGNLVGTGSAGGFAVASGALDLYRSLDGGSETVVSTNATAITGAWTYAPYDPEAGITNWEFLAEGSISYTDNDAGEQTRTLRATCTITGTGLFPYIVPPTGSTWNDRQELMVMSVELEDE